MVGFNFFNCTDICFCQLHRGNFAALKPFCQFRYSRSHFLLLSKPKNPLYPSTLERIFSLGRDGTTSSGRRSSKETILAPTLLICSVPPSMDWLIGICKCYNLIKFSRKSLKLLIREAQLLQVLQAFLPQFSKFS